MGDDRLGSARIALDALDSCDVIDLPDVPLQDASCGTVSLTARFTPAEPVDSRAASPGRPLPSASWSAAAAIASEAATPPRRVDGGAEGADVEYSRV